MISVAIVMPEIGFDEEPMRPVMRDDTVAKKKPKRTTSTAARTLPCVGRPGITARKMAEQQRAAEDDRHRDVALGAQLARRWRPRRSPSSRRAPTR